VARYKLHKQFRLPYYNYSSTGLYFITICTKNRNPLFGNIRDGHIIPSDIGKIAIECWENIPFKSPYASVDSFVTMPDHIHGIICINNPDNDKFLKEKIFQPAKRSLSIAVRSFKSAVTLQSRAIYPDIDIWQKRFFDRIIRNEKELNAIRTYIENNPMQWEADKNNPENIMM